MAGLATNHWELVVRSGVLAQHLNSLYLQLNVVALAQAKHGWNWLQMYQQVTSVKFPQGSSALELPC